MTTRDDLVSRLLIAASETTLRCWEPKHGRWMALLREATSALEAKDAEIAEWRQAASVEAGLRREFLVRAEAAESRITSLERQLAEETERCADLAASFDVGRSLYDGNGDPTPSRVGANIAAAIRGGAK